MSCAFRALPRIIPVVLISAAVDSQVVIVSPWIQNIELKPPILGTEGAWDTRERMLLSELLVYLVSTRNLTLHVVVREMDYRFQEVIDPLESKYPHRFYTTSVPFLHAKVITTDTLVLQTSANLIPTSLYRNTEACVLLANKYRNALRYLQHELDLRL